jgi:hypothetical protein
MFSAEAEPGFWEWMHRLADLIALAGLPTILVYIWRLRARLFGRRSFITRIVIEPGFKGLICCVSAPVGGKMTGDELERLVADSDRLTLALKQSPIGAILKAMERHRRDLRHCWPIGSEDSLPYFKSLGKACAKFFPHVTLHDLERVDDVYGKVDEVYNATHRIFDRCGPETDNKIKAKDVITDVTGGTTVMSIGVAMACLDIDRKIQYLEQQHRKEFYEIEVTWEKIAHRSHKPAPRSLGEFHG